MHKESGLAKAMPYLVCPKCKGALRNHAGGLFCPACGKKYACVGGVVYFSGDVPVSQANVASWEKTEGQLRAQIEEATKAGGNGMAALFFELARALSRQGLNKPEVLDEIFKYGNNLVRPLSDSDKNKRLRQEILQAASTTRYHLDEYRGCYVLPGKVMAYVGELLSGRKEKLIFEGAMGSGDNLIMMANSLGAGNTLGIGIDLSSKMALEAQSKATGAGNVFFAEGNLEKIPVADGAADCIVMNNALDRLPEPKKVAKEFRRISKAGSVFALFNCFPLQFVSSDGVMEYVPKEERMDLGDMVQESGFSVAKEYGPHDLPPWVLETIFGGKASFSMAGVVGVRK